MNIADALALASVVIAMTVAGGIWLESYKHRLSHRERKLELEVRLAEAEATRGMNTSSQVEERLRVLERIATDRKHTLAAEIDALNTDREFEGAAR